MFFYTDDEQRGYSVNRWFDKIDLYVVYLSQLLFEDFEMLLGIRGEFNIDCCSQVYAYLFPTLWYYSDYLPLEISYTKDGRGATLGTTAGRYIGGGRDESAPTAGLVSGAVPDAVENDRAEDGDGGEGSIGKRGPGYGFAELLFVVVHRWCSLLIVL